MIKVFSFRYAELVGQAFKLIFQSLVQDQVEAEAEANFLKIVINTFNLDNQVHLTVNVIEGLADFYKVLVKDGSRNGITARKLLLQAVAGPKVRESGQISLLSEILGARRKSLDVEFENSKILEERQKLLPFVEMLRRKTARGTRLISERTKIDVIDFYENDEISDIIKGHNNVHKETIISETGVKSYFSRSKRVLKIHFCDLLQAAQKQIGFKYSLRSLMNLRPPWVHLAREAHSLTCLCDRCQNMVLILRSICNFLKRIRQHGSPVDKASILNFDLSPSLTEFVSKVLHPKDIGSLWHRPDCYHQKCQSTIESPCGPEKLTLLFKPMLAKLGTTELQLIQHERVQYDKADGSVGYKFDQVETKQKLTDIVALLNERMFGTKIHKQPYVQHRLKMLLATRMRQEIHQNLSENDVVGYSDFSKELELTSQEQCKSSMFGASNQTKQLIGQVYELKVLPPGPPVGLQFDEVNQQLSFQKPTQDGGSRIQVYEVHVKHENSWFLLLSIEVKYLSSEPEIKEKIFGRLGGQYFLRVYSRNLSGLGEFSEISVNLAGDLPFHPKLEHELPEDHFSKENLTWLAEYFFLSEHGDAPKTWRTIKKCKQIALSDIRSRFCRDIHRCITVTDTGGENNGSTVSLKGFLIRMTNRFQKS